MCNTSRHIIRYFFTIASEDTVYRSNESKVNTEVDFIYSVQISSQYINFNNTTV